LVYFFNDQNNDEFALNKFPNITTSFTNEFLASYIGISLFTVHTQNDLLCVKWDVKP